LLCGIDPSLFGFLVMLMLSIRNPKVMGEHMVRRWLYALGWASVAFCIVGMFASLVCPEPDAKNLKSKIWAADNRRLLGRLRDIAFEPLRRLELEGTPARRSS
jgi:hypothetical protein